MSDLIIGQDPKLNITQSAVAEQIWRVMDNEWQVQENGFESFAKLQNLWFVEAAPLLSVFQIFSQWNRGSRYDDNPSDLGDGRNFHSGNAGQKGLTHPVVNARDPYVLE